VTHAIIGCLIGLAIGISLTSFVFLTYHRILLAYHGILLQIPIVAEEPQPEPGSLQHIDQTLAQVQTARTELLGAILANYQDSYASPVTPNQDSQVWWEHPDFPVGSWVLEIAEGNTRSSYHEWIASRLLDWDK